MFSRFDGTKRQPRAVQTEVLDWLSINWNQSPILAINAPTGIGKSAILRAIQLQFPGSVGIVPTNILMDQYIHTYPELNYIKGKDHYEFEDIYRENKDLAIGQVSTIFNPISYYMFQYQAKADPYVMIIDEAHKLFDLLMLLGTMTFRKSQYKFPEIVTFLDLLDWLGGAALYKDRDEEVIQRIKLLTRLVRDDPQDFIFYTEKRKFYSKDDEYLCIKPLRPSKSVLNRILNAQKIILMSATLLHSDLWDLGLTSYKYLDMPSPIAVENRKILYQPASIPFTYQTNPKIVADYIKGILTAHSGLNTVVHLSYGWLEKLKSYFPEALTNSSANKDQVLQQFKSKGGLWLAAGCSEGIDLPGDECRLTIIPIVIKSNIKDPVVAKQVTQERGWIKYELNMIKTVIQQAGRGTRGEDDYSLTIIGDQAFPRIVNKNRQYIPKSFLQAIKWSNYVK